MVKQLIRKLENRTIYMSGADVGIFTAACMQKRPQDVSLTDYFPGGGNYNQTADLR